MQLSEHDLKQLDEETIRSLQAGALCTLSLKLLADLKEARDRLNQSPDNSSRPPSSRAPWEGADTEPQDDGEAEDAEPQEAGQDHRGRGSKRTIRQPGRKTKRARSRNRQSLRKRLRASRGNVKGRRGRGEALSWR